MEMNLLGGRSRAARPPHEGNSFCQSLTKRVLELNLTGTHEELRGV